MNVFVIGNGSSRKGYDLEKLRNKGKIIGCNALYRDFLPDILVASDPQMIQEITAINEETQQPNYSGNFIYRTFFKNDITKMTIIKQFNNITTTEICPKTDGDTGIFAIHIARELYNPEKIFLIGFDLYETKNIYAKTKCYEKIPVFDNKAKQKAKVALCKQKGNIYKVGGSSINRIKGITYQEMEKQEVS